MARALTLDQHAALGERVTGRYKGFTIECNSCASQLVEMVFDLMSSTKVGIEGSVFLACTDCGAKKTVYGVDSRGSQK